MMDIMVRAAQQWLNSEYGYAPGWVPLAADGITGNATMGALIRALQVELKVGPLSSTFGPATLAALRAQFGDILPGTHPGSNVVRLIRAASWCKGYDGGPFFGGQPIGDFSEDLARTVARMCADTGLTDGTVRVRPKLLKGLLSTDAWTLTNHGTSVVREIQQTLNRRYVDRANFDLISTSGFYDRQGQGALMLAIQFELGMSDQQANGNLGPGTKAGLMQKGRFESGSRDDRGHLVHLFQAALIVNGESAPYSGIFDATTIQAMQMFQAFAGLPQTESSEFHTWASLLVSTGDPTRPCRAGDCSQEVTSGHLRTLRESGYTYFGRYLTNTPDNLPDKCLKRGELERILASGAAVFPIFETGGSLPRHFTQERGREVAEEADNAAWAYRMPAGTVIYFAVDWDVLDDDVTRLIIPYFTEVRRYFADSGSPYKIGVYGPRNVCARLRSELLTVSSFVADLSTGYSGNLGYRLPLDWAFDQIQEVSLTTTGGVLPFDRAAVSSHDRGIRALDPQRGAGVDPAIPKEKFGSFELAWYESCQSHKDALAQLAVMAVNRPIVAGLVSSNDSFITQLCGKFGVHKSLVLTQLIWESMVINPEDVAADLAVRTYYRGLVEHGTPGPGIPDSSTGPCQIKGATAIEARNFAVRQGLIDDPILDAGDWKTLWMTWQRVAENIEFSIEASLFVAVHEAFRTEGILPTSVRSMTASQVMRTYAGYNGGPTAVSGTNEAVSRYGRNRAALYFLIRKWHETFRA